MFYWKYADMVPSITESVLVMATAALSNAWLRSPSCQKKMFVSFLLCFFGWQYETFLKEFVPTVQDDPDC